MAKLENVKVIAERIDVGGKQYVKSTRGYEEAQVGDIAKLTVDFYDGAPAGYYEVVANSAGKIRVIDENGDYMEIDDDFEIYEKYVEPPKPARIPVGSYVKILVDSEDLPKGAVAKVTDDDKTDDYPYRCDLLDGSDWDWYMPEQIEVITGDDTRIEVGDTVLFIENFCEHKIGKTAVVREIDETCGEYGLKYGLNDSYGARTGWTRRQSVIVVSSAKQTRQQAEEKRWAAIGRKVNEYKAGDIVCIMDACGADVEVGELHEVARKYGGEGDTGALIKGDGRNWAVECELVVPVEQRFDKRADSEC